MTRGQVSVRWAPGTPGGSRRGRWAVRRLRRLARRLLRRVGLCHELSLVLTDDAGIRELNHNHRGIDRATDVLSFSQREGDAPLPHGIAPQLTLGDVVISLETAARQAASPRGRRLQAELSVLLVHGVLHLLGHDHADPPRENEPMLYLQALLLEQLQRDDITQQTRREMVRLSEG